MMVQIINLCASCINIAVSLLLIRTARVAIRTSNLNREASEYLLRRVKDRS